MLVLKYAALATVEDLFRYKKSGFILDEFPGYTHDQWGIKAHNRPWIEEAGSFSKGQKIIEVGGAYSQLARYLAEKYDLEAWVGDDFGMTSGAMIWSRWGNPMELQVKYPSVNYIYENFGTFSCKYPDNYFDRIFSVSTLEHIPRKEIVDVFKDMHRCLKSGGRQLHTIDIYTHPPHTNIVSTIIEKWPFINKRAGKYSSEIHEWIELIEDSGVKIDTSIPSSIQLMDRRILVESPDVVYRFYPPNNEPKAYQPNASLLCIIEDR